MAGSTKKLPPELRLGAIAIKMGFLTQSQLEEAVAFQEKRGMQESLGSILLMLDYLSPKTLSQALNEQKKQISKHANVPSLPTSAAGQQQFGQLAVDMSLVTEEQLKEALRIQEASTPRPFLGAVLLDLGYIGANAIPQILASQFAGKTATKGRAITVTPAPAKPAAPAPAPAKSPQAVKKMAAVPTTRVPVVQAKRPGTARVKPAPDPYVPIPVPKPVPKPVPRPVAAAEPPKAKPLSPESLQLGHIAVNMGYMTVSDLNEALGIQKRRTPKPFLGSLLVELGRLNAKALARVLAEQVTLMAQASKVQAVPKGRAEEGKFGKVAITCGFISQEQLKEALDIQGRSRPKPFLGAVLVDLGFLSPRQLSRVLAAQAAGEGFNLS
jgi:hypothetical protein